MRGSPVLRTLLWMSQQTDSFSRAVLVASGANCQFEHTGKTNGPRRMIRRGPFCYSAMNPARTGIARAALRQP